MLRLIIILLCSLALVNGVPKPQAPVVTTTAAPVRPPVAVTTIATLPAGVSTTVASGGKSCDKKKNRGKRESPTTGTTPKGLSLQMSTPSSMWSTPAGSWSTTRFPAVSGVPIIPPNPSALSTTRPPSMTPDLSTTFPSMSPAIRPPMPSSMSTIRPLISPGVSTTMSALLPSTTLSGRKKRQAPPSLPPSPSTAIINSTTSGNGTKPICGLSLPSPGSKVNSPQMQTQTGTIPGNVTTSSTPAGTNRSKREAPNNGAMHYHFLL